MGKRKAAKRGPKKRVKVVLSKEFDCLFCNHEHSITVKIDKDTKIGHLLCKACGITFQTVTNVLTEPVDVYSDWIDACNALDKKNKTMDDFVEDDEQINRAGSPNDNDLVSNDSDEDL